MARSFVVECYWPGVTAELHEDATRRASVAAAGLRGDGRDVRFLGASLVATDEAAYFRFSAESVGDVREAGDRAGLPYERVVEYVERAAEEAAPG